MHACLSYLHAYNDLAFRFYDNMFANINITNNYHTIPYYQATQHILSVLYHVADPRGTAIFIFDYHYCIQMQSARSRYVTISDRVYSVLCIV